MVDVSSKKQALGIAIIPGAVVLFLLGLAPLVPTPPNPIELAPLSLVTVVPALVGGSLSHDQDLWIVAAAMCGALLAPIAFIFVSWSIVNGGRTLSRTSIVAFIVLVILAYAFAIVSWNDTVRFTSMHRAAALAI